MRVTTIDAVTLLKHILRSDNKLFLWSPCLWSEWASVI